MCSQRRMVCVADSGATPQLTPLHNATPASSSPRPIFARRANTPIANCCCARGARPPPTRAAIFDGSLSPMFEIDGTAELTILKWNEPMAKV